MIDRITLGAASLMGVLTAATGMARWYVLPEHTPGRHQAPRVRQVLDDASLDELLGPWPEPAYGTPVTWAFRVCPNTGQDEPHALHEDGSRTCSCCFATTVSGGGC